MTQISSNANNNISTLLSMKIKREKMEEVENEE